ncbi:MAG: HEAT repeat domain-containing protein [Prosthecobacter sp.]|nr:HEAT repeat domain-containing protein [Prosthecobacter sp.]
MLSEFLLKRQIAQLVRRSHDASRMDQYDSITELGKLPPSDESIACLIQHTRDRNRATGVTAVRALGMVKDRRATDHLMTLLQDANGWLDEEVAKSLGNPHHASALPALAAIARGYVRDYNEAWRMGRVIEIMQAIDPLACQTYFEDMARPVLESALCQLQREELDKARPAWAERFLEQSQQPAGLAARRELQEHLVRHHHKVIMNSGSFDEIGTSLGWLRQTILPAAAQAVAEFMRTPSRKVTRRASYLVSDDDDPAVQYQWYDESCFTSELGQPAGPEEQAESQDAAKAREVYADAEVTRRHRENIYPVLLDHGTPDDVATYAQLCLTQPCYDLFVSSSQRDPGTPKLNRLTAMLRHAQKMPRAAELLRLILAGDRTQLWASVREALAKGIDWKPQAVELLEQTQYPALDDLLASWIEGEWSTGKPSMFTPFLSRRNPVQLAELAAQHLLRCSSSAARLEARQSVLANEEKALHVARQLHERGGWADRRDALAIVSSLGSDAAGAELRTWVAAESDQECLAEVEERRGAKFVQQCKAAAAPEPPPEQPQTPPSAAVDHAALWKRVQSCLQKRGVPTDDAATPGDLSRRADERLGTREVSRFVFEYYYPSAYGESLASDVVATAQAWVEQFERGS